MRFLCKLGWHAWAHYIEVQGIVVTCNWTCSCGAQRTHAREVSSMTWRDMRRGGRRLAEGGKWDRRSDDALAAWLILEAKVRP